ncbi:hypothetical protein M406DRAFT_322269 [Cryphonectria parasitica EP155]|uniref:Uncharacterized protein n=1 Tax=Cryphonectria parasitica (strain ATCC 38755 / EP155) TaxID=660469 RepID=A0A9P5CPI5_CRYP1|nr:uncharacterized protein M406DRAFT_322269 [Cryphonectria parasitica EP155]KAF3766188.1 hypothetical protein M406DRAFT_322269 [Cryphonectria parasitica EP155]
MDAIKKVLHHSTTTTADNTVTAQRTEGDLHANAETTAALGDEPNVTGTDRPEPAAAAGAAGEHQHQHQQPRAGHHHPRQPVGATGLPPNHWPREDFTTAAGGEEEQANLTEAAAAAAAAETGNNFPGTNPHPTHSALGNRNASGEAGSVLPGRE